VTAPKGRIVQFDESLGTGISLGLDIVETLHEEGDGPQHLAIYESATFGRVLALDGICQLTERDEFIYSEMLAHVPIVAHGAAREVLIVGGGDGAVLEEVVKHRDVARATLVEIDKRVIELSQRLLPDVCGAAFDDDRAEVVIADGAVYLANTDRRFDVIVVDSTDPIGPGKALFRSNFYVACARALQPNGILVTQSGVPLIQGDDLKSTMTRLRRRFTDVTCYMATVPTYVGGPMAFGWASDDRAARATDLGTLEGRWLAAGVTARYYTPAVHAAAFALPGYVAALLG